MDLQGKNIVYVGGFGGIGFAACKEILTRKIAKLVILDIEEKLDLLNGLKSLNPSVEVFWLQIDLCNKDSIEKSLKETVDRIKYIDVLINGSGVANEKNVEMTVTINLIGLINTVLIAVPYMDKSLGGRGGVIMNVASMLGLEPAPSAAVYSASKHGAIGFTRSVSDEYYYQRTGIMIMAFCPSLTWTSMVTSSSIEGFTFPYSTKLLHLIMDTRSQTADQCGSCLVKAIECARNGAIWKSEAAQLEEIKLTKYWSPNN